MSDETNRSNTDALTFERVWYHPSLPDDYYMSRLEYAYNIALYNNDQLERENEEEFAQTVNQYWDELEECRIRINI